MPYLPDGSTLVDSDHKHIQHYVAGRGNIEYKGTGEDGRIVNIFLNKAELFDDEQKDKEQAVMSILVKVIK